MDEKPRSKVAASQVATAVIAEIAAGQQGVITRRQALEAGISPGLITGRVSRGWLVPVFRGVYAVGLAALDRRGRWMASTLASGPGTALSHRSAAALHGVISPRSGPIEVTRRAGGGGARRKLSLPSPGAPSFHVVAYRTRSLPDQDETVIDGIPVTSLPRTFLDLASAESPNQLKSALDQAERLRVFSLSGLVVSAERGRGWSGSANLRRALSEWDPLEAETRTKLEKAMLRLCRAHGLPTPEVNTLLGEYLPDFLWREARLIVEVDGYASHGTFRAFKSDRRRDVDLMLDDFRVARFPWDEVVHNGPETANRIRKLLEMN